MAATPADRGSTAPSRSGVAPLRQPEGSGRLNAVQGRGDGAEALGGRTPLGVRLLELGTVPGHEVPPHEDLFGEGLTAEQENPGAVREVQLDTVTPGVRGTSAGSAWPPNRRLRTPPWSTATACSKDASKRQIEPAASSDVDSHQRPNRCGPASVRRRTRRRERSPSRHRDPPRGARRGGRTTGDHDGSPRVGRPRAARRPCVHPAARRASSAWAMPWPAVIRLSWPGRIGCWFPRLSECSTCPLRSQVTVCRPMWGCGPTVMVCVRRDVDGAEAIEEAPRADRAPSRVGEGPGAPAGHRRRRHDSRRS